LILHMKIFSRIAKFITEVKVELQKVSWSDRNELIGSTGVVIISTALLAIFIGIVDLIISRIISILLR
jgi:preprotein translocase subunit SecE